MLMGETEGKKTLMGASFPTLYRDWNPCADVVFANHPGLHDRSHFHRQRQWGQHEDLGPAALWHISQLWKGKSGDKPIPVAPGRHWWSNTNTSGNQGCSLIWHTHGWVFFFFFFLAGLGNTTPGRYGNEKLWWMAPLPKIHGREAKLTGITADGAAFLKHIKLLCAMPGLDMIR